MTTARDGRNSRNGVITVWITLNGKTMTRERHAFEGQVFPDIAELCERFDHRLDVRWGPSCETAGDPQTIEARFDEMAELQLGEPAPIFLVLLDGCAGIAAPPPAISVTDYTTVRACGLPQDDVALLDKCYRLAEGEDACYRLQPSRGMSEEQRTEINGRLCAILRKSARMPGAGDDARSVLTCDLLEREVVAGALGGDPNRALCFFRALEEEPGAPGGDAEVGECRDPHIDQLMEELRTHAPDGHVLQYRADCDGADPDDGCFDALCRDASLALNEAIVNALRHPEPSTPANASVPEGDSQLAHPVDENVQFTVYRPEQVKPDTWHDLLVFAHLSKRRPNAPEGTPDPVQEVEKMARQTLGAAAAGFDSQHVDSGSAIPRHGEMTFKPQVDGIEFVPREHTFRWSEDVHLKEFKLHASGEMDGETARGHVWVFLGVRIVGQIPVAIQIDSQASPPAMSSLQASSRKVFCSYSHDDSQIVDHINACQKSLGHDIMVDRTDLVAGRNWWPQLQELISGADLFQLFWSTNSMGSENVRDEYEYALSLDRPPMMVCTHWEEPFPSDEDDAKRPEFIGKLHSVPIPRVATTTGLRGALSRIVEAGRRLTNLDAVFAPRINDYITTVRQQEQLLGDSQSLSSEAAATLAAQDPERVITLGEGDELPLTDPFVATALREEPKRVSVLGMPEVEAEYVLSVYDDMGYMVATETAASPSFTWPSEAEIAPGSSCQWEIRAMGDGHPADWDRVRGFFVTLTADELDALAASERESDSIEDPLVKSLLLASVKTKSALFSDALADLEFPNTPVSYEDALRVRVAADLCLSARAWLSDKLPGWAKEITWLGDQANQYIEASYAPLTPQQ